MVSCRCNYLVILDSNLLSERHSLLQLVNGPGFEFLGDKQFCMYVDRLIDFYLGEKPIIRSIPTLSFAEHDPDQLLSAIFDNPQVK